TFLLAILLTSNTFLHTPLVKGYTVTSASSYSSSLQGEGNLFTVYKEGLNFYQYNNISTGFTVDTYGFTTKNSFLNFSNIIAYNVSYVVEDDPTSVTRRLNPEQYMSFTVNMSCVLANISFKVNLVASDSYLDIGLYNSSWDGVKPVYSYRLYITTITIPSVGFDGWYNVTVNWPLDTSNTHNNTFFIGLNPGGLADSGWYRVPDDATGDNDDEGYAYEKGGTLLPYDFELKVDLSPIKSNPSPSDMALKVNATSVNDTSYGGTWESHERFDGDIFFNITANWTVSFDVNVTLLENLTGVSESVYYTVYTNKVEALWNITINITKPQTFVSINGTFKKPPDWALKNVYVNGTITTQYERNGNNITLIGVGLWNVILNSTNYLAEPLNAITTYNGKNTSLDFVFAQDVSSQNNGTAKITVYNTTSDSIVNYTTTPTNNGTYDLVQAFWIPDSSLPSGTYNVTALWCNGTEVGYRVKQVILVHPAYITSSYTDKDHLIGDNVTIVINYIRNDTSEGITGATVTGSWIYQSGIIFNDDGNGQYSAEVPTYPDYKNGTFQFTITATKLGYQDQTYVVNITLIYKTDLVGDTSYSVQYEDSVTISVTYKFEYDDTAIPGATVYFDFQNGTVVEMKDYNNDGTYTLDVSSNVTAGTYNFVITASKQGYQAKTLSGTLTVYNVSTKLTTVNETTEYSIYYNEKSNITFYYNDSGGQGISGAITSYTSIYKNGSLVELGNGYYALQIAIKDVDTINFTITVEKMNYQSQTIVITVTVLSRPTEVELLYNENYNAGDVFNITIAYKDTLSSEYIPNATVTVLSNASNFQVFNLGNGTYKIQLIYNTYIAFDESLFVNITSYGFSTNRSAILYHINLKSLTSPTYKYESLVPFAENETILVHYGVNGTPIIELNVSLDYVLISYNNGSYSIILKTDKSYPGVYSVELKIQIINYESFVIQFSFEIKRIPAHTEVVGDPENYWGGEIILSIYFYDDYNGTYLDNWNLTISGLPSTVYSTVWLGTHYNLTIYSNKLNATIYPITITASKLYYNQSYYEISINILKSSFAPDYPQNVSQYENETLTISLTLYDYHFENPVGGANVTLVLNEIEYQAQNPVDGIYVLNISLLGFTPGNYSASLIITKLNYEQYQTDIAVRVLKKYGVVLELILPEKFVAGAENTISAKLTYTNGTPISYERINFDISIKLENNSVIEYHVFDDTDTDGIATVVIQLPYETKERLIILGVCL
ncbi:MAG: hypothetical protein J7L47_00260, partial [Candidatus Odinarchaeota archaeon]|nr:hypothetical protein [Candidatus Odinarchaeota archaeon]